MIEQTNDSNVPVGANGAPGPGEIIPVILHRGPGGRPRGSYTPGTKHASSIAKRLKADGVDWVVELAACVKRQDYRAVELWVRLAPYLVTAGNGGRVKRRKGKPGRSALAALDELEGR
jgi:hypothetical protein